MPFTIKKVKNGYKVQSTDTKKYHSKKPLSKSTAEKQKKVIEKSYYKKKIKK